MSDDPPPEEDPPKVAEQEETHNLLDPTRRRKQLKRIDIEAEEASMFWRDVFSTTVGRREMWGLLRDAQPDGNPFVPPFACGPNGFPQSEATWFRAGQYALGQHFYQRWIQLARDGALLMLDEHDPRFVHTAKARRKKG